MAKEKIIGTLRRLTRMAQKRRERERKAAELALVAQTRERERKEKIYASREPEAISDLVTEEILEKAKRVTQQGCYTAERSLSAIRNDTEVKKLVVAKLEKEGLAAVIICGQGHERSSDCDGTTRESCWPEIHISWGKNSKNWHEPKTPT